VDTIAGILQVLALWLNTSLTCEQVPHSDYPATCDAIIPFTASYSDIDRPEAYGNHSAYPILTFQACTPGDFNWIPAAGGNSHNIVEDLYMDRSIVVCQGVGSRDRESASTVFA